MIKIDKELFEPIKIKASDIERQRCNYNFHKHPDDPLQRLLNVMNTKTYIRPHKHENPDKREVFIVLEGKGLVIEFDNYGKPTEAMVLNNNTGNYACEIAPRTWHTIICLEDHSVFYEIKDGPYNAIVDKNFAPWAPEEGSEEASEFNIRLLKDLGVKV